MYDVPRPFHAAMNGRAPVATVEMRASSTMRRHAQPRSRGDWRLNEFLSLLVLEGRSWCFVEMGEQSGFRLSRSEHLTFHAVLDGNVRITTAASHVMEASAGDIVVVLPGDKHKIRNHHGSTAFSFEFPPNPDDSISLPTVHVGPPGIASRLLCGSLNVHWPGGIHPARIPGIYTLKANQLGIELARLIGALQGPSAPAILSHLATLFFVTAFRDEPRCRAQFRWNLGDPIVRATVLIEKYPSREWTVESLATEVGMGRSNFAARFTAQTGHTPIDALTGERMRHAEELLRNTSLKIAEISERVGYRSEGAFIRRFTVHFGVTPSRFRRWPWMQPQDD